MQLTCSEHFSYGDIIVSLMIFNFLWLIPKTIHDVESFIVTYALSIIKAYLILQVL